MNLVAHWKTDRDPTVDSPSSITWSDGSLASINDYFDHLEDTLRLETDRSGTKCYIYPDVVAEVYYDRWARTWAIRGDGVAAGALDESDPDASDENLKAAACALPTAYRVSIVRS